MGKKLFAWTNSNHDTVNVLDLEYFSQHRQYYNAPFKMDYRALWAEFGEWFGYALDPDGAKATMIEPDSDNQYAIFSFDKKNSQITIEEWLKWEN